MKPLAVVTVLVLAALLTSTTQVRAADSIVGTWKLVSWVVTSPSGEVSHPYGSSPEGQIIYTDNGQMSAQLMNPGATLPDPPGSSREEVMGRVLGTYFAYYGTYEIDAAAQTVTHHVLGSLAPSWTGSDQVREVQFLEGDRVELIARLAGDDTAESAGAGGSNVLIWERVR